MAFDPAPLLALVARAEALVARLEGVLPHPLTAPDWNVSTAFRYRTRGGTGGRLEPVRHVASIRLASLVEVDAQKERIVRNTEQYVAGKAANNMLLTGARGTGKSSLIKACLNEFAPRAPVSSMLLAALPATNCSVLRTMRSFCASTSTSEARRIEATWRTGSSRPPVPPRVR